MRYQIRCVCGHLSAFEIIPMPVVPSHRDMKISDEPQNRVVAQLKEANADLLAALEVFVANWGGVWIGDDQDKADPDGSYGRSSKLTAGDIRKAREAIRKAKGGEDETE